MSRLRLSVGLSVMALILVSGGFLLGDDKKPDDPKVKGSLPTHWKKLGLSDEQTQKVYKIQANYGGKIAALKQQIEDLQAEEKTEREKVLTDDQKKHLREILLGEKEEPKDKAPAKDKEPVKDKPADK
jgi:hypothetical protein